LNGGVAVIETGRIFGGDSGYAYVGEIKPSSSGWEMNLTIKRHDTSIVSVFGDINEFSLSGTALAEGHDERGNPTLIAQLSNANSPIDLVVRLTKAAELP
jgi:hypothetical protein